MGNQEYVEVRTIEGYKLLLRRNKIVLVGPITADGQPVLGQCKILVEGVGSLLLAQTVDEVGGMLNA